MAAAIKLLRRQTYINLNPNQILVNPHLYDNDNLEVRYAQLLDRWRWTRGWVHAIGWVYFNMALILIFALLYLQDWRIDKTRLKVALANTDRYPTMDEYAHRSFLDRISTHIRSFSYKRTRGRWWWRGMANMSLGMGLLVLAGWAYPILYVFTQRPYYKPFAWYGPPGLASRSGMIGIAMTPFTLVLGMKANLISWMTGVGHERLNVLHRWLGLLTGIMALTHTIPFLWEPIRDGGWQGLKDMLLHRRGHIVYWNGFGALVCLGWLCIASLPFIRRRFYEIFKYTHIVAGVGYVGMLFWHCGNMLTSWHYLWATVAIWITGLGYRFVFKSNLFSFSQKWLSGDRATFTKLTDDGIKITITTKMKWKPGQHVFLRIPEISWLENHPFTIASIMKNDENDPEKNERSQTLSNSDANTAQDKQSAQTQKVHMFGGNSEDSYNDMVLVFKPYKGFTKRAWEISRTKPDVSFKAYLDGPYGGMPRALECFDTVLFIAGGSGITPIVAHLQDLCEKIRKGKAVTADIRIVWTVKRFESLEWFKDEISVATRSVPFGTVHCQYFVTEESPVEFPDYPFSATKEWPDSPFPNTPRDELNPNRDSVPPVPAVPGLAVTTSGHFPSAYPQYPEIPKNFSQYPSYQQQPQQPQQPQHQHQYSQYPQYQYYPSCPQHPQPVHTHAPVASYSPIGVPAGIDTEVYSPASLSDDKKELLNSTADVIELQETSRQRDVRHSSEVKEQESREVRNENPSSNEKRISDMQVQEIGAAFTTNQPDNLGAVTLSGQNRKSLVGSRDGPKLFIPGSSQDRDGMLTAPQPIPDFGDEVTIEFGRPRLREGIRPWAEEFGRRTCIYVCGPESMKIDVSNAVASLQQDIWINVDREEVYLHTETFGW